MDPPNTQFFKMFEVFGPESELQYVGHISDGRLGTWARDTLGPRPLGPGLLRRKCPKRFRILMSGNESISETISTINLKLWIARIVALRFETGSN